MKAHVYYILLLMLFVIGLNISYAQNIKPFNKPILSFNYVLINDLSRSPLEPRMRNGNIQKDLLELPMISRFDSYQFNGNFQLPFKKNWNFLFGTTFTYYWILNEIPGYELNTSMRKFYPFRDDERINYRSFSYDIGLSYTIFPFAKPKIQINPEALLSVASVTKIVDYGITSNYYFNPYSIGSISDGYYIGPQLNIGFYYFPLPNLGIQFRIERLMRMYYYTYTDGVNREQDFLQFDFGSKIQPAIGLALKF